MGTADPDKRRAGARLADRAWTDVADGPAAVLLVPVGSCEQHGPHLPLDTDARVAVAVAERAAARRSDVLVAPALAYGSSGEHAGFPGTLSIGAGALRLVLVELARSAFPRSGSPASGRGGTAWRALLFVNGHGGNAGPVAEAVRVLGEEGRPVGAWSPRVTGGDAHAGRTETSLLLALAPAVVGDERPAGATQPLADLLPTLQADGVAAVAPNGVLGDAAGASAEEGERLVDAFVDDLLAAVDRLTGGS